MQTPTVSWQYASDEPELEATTSLWQGDTLLAATLTDAQRRLERQIDLPSPLILEGERRPFAVALAAHLAELAEDVKRKAAEQ